MLGNELIRRRNLLLLMIIVIFYLTQVAINIYVEGIESVFPPAFLFVGISVVLFLMIFEKVHPQITMYTIVICMYVYFYFLLQDSPYLVNYLFMWLGLPLSAIYQNYRVVYLALTASLILNYYAFFYLHSEIFPNVVKGDFVFLVLFGVFTTAFLVTYIHMTLKLWRETKEANAKLEELAYHDPLTGAANRLLLKKTFEQLKGSKVESIALLYTDMDGFKKINDAYGHEVGDQLLEKTVSRLKGKLRSTDLLCRLGGDEFVILLSNVEPDIVRHLVERIHQSLKEPLIINQQTLQMSASIGWSHTTKIAQANLNQLLKEADREMYEEKQKRGAGERSPS